MPMTAGIGHAESGNHENLARQSHPAVSRLAQGITLTIGGDPFYIFHVKKVSPADDLRVDNCYMNLS